MHSGYAYDLFSIYCIFYILDRCWNEWPRYILYYVIKQIFFYFQHSLCSNSNFWLDCNCTASFLSQLCTFSSNEMEREREKEKESNIKLQGWHVSSKNEKSFDMLLICIHWHTHTQNVYITNAVHPFGFQHKSVSVEVFAFFILAFKNGL